MTDGGRDDGDGGFVSISSMRGCGCETPRLLTALQLQGAHLSVHGVLGQVHVTGDGGCDAGKGSNIREHCGWSE